MKIFKSIFCLLCLLLFTNVSADIIYVPADTLTIQGGIFLADEGDTVLVAENTYFENINFNGKSITVASHFIIDGDTTHIDGTIIDGSQPSHPDSGSVVYFISGEDTNSVLCGFTITGGTGTIAFVPNLYDFRAGGGIAFGNSGGRIVSNKIINNTVSDDNEALGGGISAGFPGVDFWIILENNQIMNNTLNSVNGAYGGGVYLGGNGKLVNNIISYDSCTATESWAGGGGVHTYALPSLPCTVIIEGNHINHNFIQGKSSTTDPWSAFGGGIKVYRSKVSILNNEISNNLLKDHGMGNGSGGGIYMYLAASGSIISGNTISNNNNEVTGTKYGGGIGLGQSDGLSITNNIIFKNSASRGGGISLTYNDAAIINNTIFDNTSSSIGGGLHSSNSNPVVINTILWDNQAVNGAGIYPSTLAKIRYSDIQDGYSGTGNINANPLFVDTILYNLSDSSHCVGWGTNSVQISGTWYYAPGIDYDGDPRPNPVDNFVDMGAQESNFLISGIINEDSDYFPNTFSLIQNYPNPFNPSTRISFTLLKPEHVTLTTYNILGKKVTTLLETKMNAGLHDVTFNASDLPSGIYFYRIQAGEFSQVKKMVLLR